MGVVQFSSKGLVSIICECLRDNPLEFARMQSRQCIEFDMAFAVPHLEILLAPVLLLDGFAGQVVLLHLRFREHQRLQPNIRFAARPPQPKLNLAGDGDRHCVAGRVEVRNVEDADGAIDFHERQAPLQHLDYRRHGIETDALFLGHAVLGTDRIEFLVHRALLDPAFQMIRLIAVVVVVAVDGYLRQHHRAHRTHGNAGQRPIVEIVDLPCWVGRPPRQRLELLGRRVPVISESAGVNQPLVARVFAGRLQIVPTGLGVLVAFAVGHNDRCIECRQRIVIPPQVLSGRQVVLVE